MPQHHFSFFKIPICLIVRDLKFYFDPPLSAVFLKSKYNTAFKILAKLQNLQFCLNFKIRDLLAATFFLWRSSLFIAASMCHHHFPTGEATEGANFYGFILGYLSSSSSPNTFLLPQVLISLFLKLNAL